MSEVSGNTSVAGEASVWLARLETMGRSPRTVSTYETAIRNLDRYLAKEGRARPQDVQSHDLEAWRLHLIRCGCTTATVNLFVRTARQLFRWLLASGRLFCDPAQNLAAPKVLIPLGSCPTEDDVIQLLDSIKGRDRVALRDRAILETAYATGARLEELTRLDLISLGDEAMRLRGKGGRERVVPLTTTAIQALADYLSHARPHLLGSSGEDRALFLSIQGRRLCSQSIANVVETRALRCDLKITITPHSIRRAFATHLLRGGAPLGHVKDLLGHQTYRHLRHYVRLHPAEVLETARNSKPGRR